MIGYVSTALNILHTGISKVGTAFNWWITKLREGHPVITGVTILLGALLAGMAAYEIKLMAVAAWNGICSAATAVWTAIQWGLNAALWASPITWIVAAIVALIGVIAYVALTTKGWGETWHNTWEYIKLSFQQAGASLKLTWLKVQNAFLTGFEVIKIGWFKLKSLWDKEGANVGLAAIEADRNRRAAEIAEAQGKVNELARKRDEIDIWQVKSNGKGLSDIVGDLKGKLGISSPGVPGMGAAASADGSSGSGSGAGSSTSSTDAVATGGKRTTNITIKLDSLVGKIVF